MEKRYKFLEHTADVKFQSYGSTIEEVFTNAAYALKDTITKGIEIKEKIKWTVNAGGKDDPALLYNFLEEFLFLFDSENFIFSKILSFEMKNDEIKAEVIGDRVSNYKLSNDVKAITYNDMFVKQNKKDASWTCQVVLDV